MLCRFYFCTDMLSDIWVIVLEERKGILQRSRTIFCCTIDRGNDLNTWMLRLKKICTLSFASGHPHRKILPHDHETGMSADPHHFPWLQGASSVCRPPKSRYWCVPLNHIRTSVWKDPVKTTYSTGLRKRFQFIDWCKLDMLLLLTFVELTPVLITLLANTKIFVVPFG